MTESGSEDRLARVLAYHDRTMHRVDRYARSLGYMDWANQPDPFRRYADAESVALDLVPVDADGTDTPLDDLADPSSLPPRPLSRAALSQLLFDSLALSAWKEYQGSRWSLRVNPSSGNLHPTEGYVLCDAVDGIGDSPALFHYAPHDHVLERRWRFTSEEWRSLTAALPDGSLLVGFTSIHWRESWKYGERAYRYCQHDAGHALAAVALAAACLGWHARLAQGLGDDDLALLLGVHAQRGIEAEHPDALVVLSPSADLPDAPRVELSSGLRVRLRAELGSGSPNALSEDHHEWPIIDDVAEACAWPAAAAVGPGSWSAGAPPALAPRAVSARRIIRQRRSAVAMDGATRLDRGAFFHMLARLHAARAPFATLPWRPAVHPVLFVHRVDGVDPGLYLLVRDPARRDALRTALRGEFRWSRPPGCPDDLALWTLALGPCDHAARSISCGQDIAADGAFAVGMLAEFAPRLAEHGPWFYRCLHQEAGAVGQVLYLEAEAAGVRSTGIGCFLDDLMHELLGVGDDAWRTLYHFTVGGAVDDPRLRSLEAYAHLGRGASGVGS